MSLFYQHTINQNTKLGIWKIEEAEAFFLQKVPVQKNITHPHKRLQHLAGRYVLQYLFPNFPYAEILIADTRKPYLQNEQYHFSISHCGSYAAAIVSATKRVGIDIEIPSIKVKRIAHKFVHTNETQYINQSMVIGQQSTVNNQLLTIIWSSKEAIFKWYSLGSVDFKDHIQLNGSIQKQNDSLQLPFIFKKEKPIYLNISATIFDEVVLSWVVNDF